MKDHTHLEFARFAQEIARRPAIAAATNTATRKADDGGFAVPTDAADMILAPSVGALLPLCTVLPVANGGSIELPVDLSTAYTEAGIISGWQDETDQLPEYKPSLKKSLFTPRKLITLVPVSDELLSDSAALAAYLPLAMQTAVTRRINEAILSGPGVARPLGILKANATITVAKEGAQAAGSIVAANLTAMLARSLNPTASHWIMNPALYGQIIGLAAWDGASRTLAGRPVVLTDACPAPGNPGDIVLAEMQSYLVAMKDPGRHMSTHLWFDQDVNAFRLTVRLDGMPMLAAPITPPNSTVTRSHFVTLAERS